MAAHFDAIELLTRYETPLIKDMEKDDDVLEWVAAYVGSESFQDTVDAFCEDHGEKFKLLMAKGGPSAEQLAQVEECVSNAASCSRAPFLMDACCWKGEKGANCVCDGCVCCEQVVERAPHPLH